MSFNIYRVASKKKEVGNKLFCPHATMLPPGNVPYGVDNLWELARPLEYPNRKIIQKHTLYSE